MNFRYFSLKVVSGMLHFQDANFSVSSPFSKSDVNDSIIEKLRKINFIPDLKTVSYVIKDNQLYVEGIAYEDTPPSQTDAFFG